MLQQAERVMDEVSAAVDLRREQVDACEARIQTFVLTELVVPSNNRRPIKQ